MRRSVGRRRCEASAGDVAAYIGTCGCVELAGAFVVGRGMKKIGLIAVMVVTTSFLVPGCATVPREGGVAVSLVSIRPLDSSLFESSAELTLRLTNESPRVLALSGSTHRLYVNGTYIGRAVTNERVTIPQLGTTTQKVTAHVENLTLMRKAQELGNVAAVDYRIDSQLFPADDPGGGSFAASATGRLDLSGLLPEAPLAPRAQ